MIEMQWDLWKIDADAHVITTNGDVNAFGLAVMGRGCAYEAARHFPGLARDFGQVLRHSGGNHLQIFPFLFAQSKTAPRVKFIVTFPVKHHWHERADLKLIERSVRELLRATDENEFTLVALPRPGCGNGRLSWDAVRPLLAPLDDRFVVVHK